MRSNLLRMVAACLPLAGLGACGSTEGNTVSDMVGWIERVHVESELAKKNVQVTSEMMTALVGNSVKGDPIAAYQEFTKAISESESQANRLRAAVRQMQSAAQPVFDQWSSDLLKISNQQIRRRSDARMDATLQRYQALLAATKSAESGYDSFNQGVRDLSLFLGHDLNATALAEVRQDARAITDLALELDGRFNRTLEAARDYIASASLGGTTELRAAPPGGSHAEPQPAPQTTPARK
ncbi:MAG: DUF2959 family protein [Planctomycetes bacterium]|nr:DUF2959 family protein [Planctomycetota bacterium]